MECLLMKIRLQDLITEYRTSYYSFDVDRNISIGQQQQEQ